MAGGSIQFVHILRTEKYEIVHVNAARFLFAREKGAFFVIDKVGLMIFVKLPYHLSAEW